MAPIRAFSFPLSQAEEITRTPPFTIDKADALRLHSSEAFQIVRSLLAERQDFEFCEHHNPSNKAEIESWLLQRDVTHALILPVLKIQHHATQIAKSVLGNRNIFDLELVYRGEARGAFAWLQCFIAEEEAWCSADGCPACNVSYVLEAEPTIRLVLVACRLSQSLRQPKQGSDLPMFDFWSRSLRNALDNDPFWGPGFWKDIEGRASMLEKGIQQLVQQCYELNNVVSQTDQVPQSPEPSRLPYQPTKPTKLRASRLAERQIALTEEEDGWMQKIVLGCWTTLLADAAKARRTSSSTKFAMQPLLKARSLTS